MVILSLKIFSADNPKIKQLFDVKNYTDKYGEKYINFIIAYFMNLFLEIFRIILVLIILKKFVK